jgi:hypothetical protein
MTTVFGSLAGVPPGSASRRRRLETVKREACHTRRAPGADGGVHGASVPDQPPSWSERKTPHRGLGGRGGPRLIPVRPDHHPPAAERLLGIIGWAFPPAARDARPPRGRGSRRAGRSGVRGGSPPRSGDDGGRGDRLRDERRGAEPRRRAGHLTRANTPVTRPHCPLELPSRSRGEGYSVSGAALLLIAELRGTEIGAVRTAGGGAADRR